MKRLTDTEIWGEDWFINLPNKYKLFWFYLKDKCDNVGIWRPNIENFQKVIGEPINLQDFLNYSNNPDDIKIIVLSSNKWFIKKFFSFQYGHVFNLKSPIHRGAMKQLVNNGVHLSELHNVEIGNLQTLDLQQLKQIGYIKGTDRVMIEYENSINRDKDKDKDKAKDKNKDKDFGKSENLYEDAEIVDDVVPDTLVNRMVGEWKKSHPAYPIDKEKDFPACWQIALKIGQQHNWEQHEIVNGKMEEVITEWKDYILFIQTDRFYSNLQLARLNSEWQGLVFKKSKGIASTVKTDLSGGFNTGVANDDVYKNMRK